VCISLERCCTKSRMAENSNGSYSGWVWLSKVKDHKDSLDQTFSSSNFHKRKKRYLSVYESFCIYRYSPDHKDSKSISLLTLSPLLILGSNDLPSLIYLIDSVTREIYVIIEPEDIHTTTTLCNILTIVCDNSRISTMKQIITEDNSENLSNILNYCRHTKSLMEEINFSSYGNALHFTLAMKSIQCLPIIFFTLGVSSLSIENLQSQLPIHVAILTSHETLIKTFIQIVSSYGLKSNELLNMSNQSLQTAFHMITDEEMIPLLVPYGAQVDSFDSNGLTPLMVACQKKLTYLAIEFMDFGVNLNKPCWVNGFTPLMYSCLPGNDELVKELLDRDADIHQLDNYNRTALHHACMNGHLFSCVLFLNMGINLDLQDLFGATALCYSAASPLHGTVAATHELIGLLIARGSYPKIRDVCGRQALHYAAGKILFFGLIIVSIPLLLLPPSPLT
jgi:ankyrin repeat protein